MVYVLLEYYNWALYKQILGKRSKLIINQAPSVDSYTTILPVQILVLLKLLKAGFDWRLFWEVWKARMAVFRRAWQWWVCAWSCTVCQMLSVWFISQNVPIILSLSILKCNPLPTFFPASHPFVSTYDTSFACVTSQIFSYLFGKFKTTGSTKGSLKCDKLMNLLCKFHTHACFPRNL